MKQNLFSPYPLDTAAKIIALSAYEIFFGKTTFFHI